MIHSPVTLFKPSEAVAGTLLMIAVLTIMVGTVIVPGLPFIAMGLGIGAPDWLVTLPSLGVVIGSPVIGWVIARTGAWRTLAFGLFFYGLLGTAGSLLRGPAMVYTDRFLLGVATSAVMAGGTTLIATFWRQPEARLRMIAVQGMAIELGGVAFLSAGGFLAAVDWRYPFLVYLLAWPLLIAQICLVPCPASVLNDEYGGGGATWHNSPLGVFAAATASMAIFFTGTLGLPTALAFLGLRSGASGVFLGAISLVAVVAAWLLPRILSALGARNTLVAAFACYLLAFTLFAAQASLPLMALGGLLAGIGFGLTVPLANHLVIEAAARDIGPPLAMLSMAIFLGQFLASFVMLVPGGTSAAFATAVAIALIAIVACRRHPALTARAASSHNLAHNDQERPS